MNKLTKITAIALLTITAGTSLAGCATGTHDSKGNGGAIFKKAEPKYDKSLTLEKIKESVLGDANNETTDLTGKVFKIKVDHIGSNDDGSLKGIVPVQDESMKVDGENIFSIVPSNQGNIKAKKGDTVYLKIKNQTAVFGLVVLNVEEITK